MLLDGRQRQRQGLCVRRGEFLADDALVSTASVQAPDSIHGSAVLVDPIDHDARLSARRWTQSRSRNELFLLGALGLVELLLALLLSDSYCFHPSGQERNSFGFTAFAVGRQSELVRI